MKASTRIGLFGAIGIWLSAGIGLPFVNLLDMLDETQLMVIRGLSTAIIAFIGMRGKLDIKKTDRHAFLLAVFLPFATLGLYKGLRYWGAGLTIVVITATPLINVFFSLVLKRKISRFVWIALPFVLGGVTLACLEGAFSWPGFLWSLFATIMNALLYEFMSKSKAKPLQKCFWASLSMGVLGIALSTNTDWAPLRETRVLELVSIFAFVGGFLYWLANLIAFEKLNITTASVLAQGETPAVIIGAWLIVGETMNFNQALGVTIALAGTIYLAYKTGKENEKNKKRSR